MTLLCEECEYPLKYDGSRGVYKCPRCNRVYDESTALDTYNYTIRDIEIKKIPKILRALESNKKPKMFKETTHKRVVIPTLKTLGLLLHDKKLTKTGRCIANIRSIRKLAKALLELIEAVETQLERLHYNERSKRELELLKRQCIRYLRIHKTKAIMR